MDKNERVELIQDTGYGLIPRKIMRNKDISIQAKAIYSYLASFAGNTGRAFPSVSLMLGELGISRDTFYKYRNELEEVGAMVVEKERSRGQFAKNIYYLNNQVNAPCPKSSDTVNSDTVNSDTVNSDTNSNNSISNKFNSNTTTTESGGSEFKDLTSLFQNNGFGLITSTTSEILIDLVDDFTIEWVIDAMTIAVENNKRNLGYVGAILRRWKAEGKDDHLNKDSKKMPNEYDNFPTF